jgi:hypothetical protein
MFNCLLSSHFLFPLELGVYQNESTKRKRNDERLGNLTFVQSKYQV